jgi:hypothetical protein
MTAIWERTDDDRKTVVLGCGNLLWPHFRGN